ncbi:MAG: D-2-hydroxyacid dehydrogenase [Candidatus Binatia bacterium]
MENSPRLVVLDAATFGDAALEPFAHWPCTIYPFSPPESVAERLQGHSAAAINKVVLDRATLRHPAAKDLKLIAVAATGTDNVDLDAARSLGIGVCNVPGYATQSVAQFTMALILELASHAGAYARRVREGAWEKSPVFTLLDYSCVELATKTLGIIGYGNIGKAVASMARGFGLDIRLSARPGTTDPLTPGRLPLEEVLREADFLTLHCPLTADTKNLIDARALNLMKPGAFLINTARGALVDTTALIEALRSGHLAGAALDVLTQEPPSLHHPLIEAARELENLLITPHCAWATREARQRLIAEVAKNIAAFERGGQRNRVV